MVKRYFRPSRNFLFHVRARFPSEGFVAVCCLTSVSVGARGSSKSVSTSDSDISLRVHAASIKDNLER